MSSSSQPVLPSRNWLIFGGVLSVIIGFFAMGAPVVFTYVLTQLLGALLLVSGVVGVFMAIFGHQRPHRVLSGLSGLIRLAAGASLFFFTISGMAALTIILAVVFVIEGLVCIATSLAMRANPAWIWILLNGVVALVLGGMIYAQWPVDAEWIIGLLYGIQSIFGGASLIVLGLKTRPA